MTAPITSPEAPTYRAYRLDRAGRIVGRELVQAANDTRAVAAARSMAALFTIELWERDRLVARFEPDPHGQHG